MAIKMTHEDYITKIKHIHSNIEVLCEYVNARTKILHKCKICGYEWVAQPNSILSGCGCPKCSGTMRLTQKEYEKRVEEINTNIKVLDKYINMNTKILHQCKVCRHKWNIKPSDIVNKHGCPICSGKIIGNPPEYKNSIWASKYKNYFIKYMTEEQMKIYTPNSNKIIEVLCPDCGRYKKISPNTLFQHGLGCICGDGISYPNKFMYSVLKQLNIEIMLEYSPEWANKKKYDIYIPNLNCIIENHGFQHYKDGFTLFGKTYEYEKQNDKYKEEIARENGIQSYIIIDCRYSNEDWIKQSILNSDLPNILNFSEYDINWCECDKFATSNLVKIVSELWNNGMCVEEIRDKMELSKNTIYNYLNKGAKFSMCNYTGILSRERTKKYKNN